MLSTVRIHDYNQRDDLFTHSSEYKDNKLVNRLLPDETLHLRFLDVNFHQDYKTISKASLYHLHL